MSSNDLTNTPSGFSDSTVLDPIEPHFPIPDTPTELPHFIPPTHQARTLVLCFDGTGDQFDSDNSNIVEFFTMLKKDDKKKQMVYYQAGIGTYTSPQVATPMAAKISKALDEAVAWNLDAHVMDGYEFLMENYQAGDRICIFGFSRGAYTARGLAGMIHKVGVLPASNRQQVPFAYKMFTRTDEIGWKQSIAFKKAFSVDVEIEFIGVWDTVNSVGLIPVRLPYTGSNSIVKTFRHAIALDERRAKFKANHWILPTVKQAQDPTDTSIINSQKVQNVQNAPSTSPTKGKAPESWNAQQRILETKYSGTQDRVTDVEEVWFAGCHCDVGGGSVQNGTPNTLARIALRWMIRECFKTETGILFVTDRIHPVGLDPACLYPVVKPRPPRIPGTGSHIQRIPKGPPPPLSYEAGDDLITIQKSEEEEELLDALSPIYDQLSLSKIWWILELIPFKYKMLMPDGTWRVLLECNMGGGRHVPRQDRVVRMHRSVLTRMEARYEDGEEYIPKAEYNKAKELGTIMWVD